MFHAKHVNTPAMQTSVWQAGPASMSDLIATKLARRIGGPLKTVLGKLPTRVGTPLLRLLRTAYRFSQGSSTRRYDVWVKNFDTITPADRDKICAHISGFDRTPLISVVMPVYETPEWALRQAIDSIRRQLYPY